MQLIQINEQSFLGNSSPLDFRGFAPFEKSTPLRFTGVWPVALFEHIRFESINAE